MEPNIVDISFHTEDVDHPFADKEDQYITWLLSVAKAENKTIENLTYIFCSDEYLLDINIKHLGHDYYTDIITFPYKEGDTIQSDMYISTERVADNAQEYGETFDDELRRVMVHGLLHLMGYGDKRKEDVAVMRDKEDECIGMFG